MASASGCGPRLAVQIERAVGQLQADPDQTQPQGGAESARAPFPGCGREPLTSVGVEGGRQVVEVETVHDHGRSGSGISDVGWAAER